MCPSQYDLVEALPVVGHAIQLNRTDGSMINPYFVKVIQYHFYIILFVAFSRKKLENYFLYNIIIYCKYGSAP